MTHRLSFSSTREVELIQFNYQSVSLFLTTDPASVTWNNQLYASVNMEVGSVDQLRSQRQSFTFTVSPASQSIEDFVRRNDYLRGSSVSLIQADLGRTQAINTVTYNLSSLSIDTSGISFICRSPDLTTPIFPALSIKGLCQNRFRDAFCKFAGVGASCDKELDTCRGYSNTANFKASPYVGGRQT